MNESVLAQILLDSLSEDSDVMHTAEAKLIELSTNAPEMMLVLSSNILNADNYELKLYKLALIAIKNTLNTFSAIEQQRQFWLEKLSEEIKENIKNAIVRGFLMPDISAGNLAGSCAEIIFKIDGEHFNIFVIFNQILEAEEPSNASKESVFVCLIEILQDDFIKNLDKKIINEHIKPHICSILQIAINFASSPTNYEVSMIRSIIHFLTVVIEFVKNELNNQQSQEIIVEMIANLLPLVNSVELYQDIHEFMQQYVMIFIDLRWNEIPRIIELVEIGINSQRTEFACISIDFWKDIADYELGRHLKRNIIDYFCETRDKICAELHFTRQIKEVEIEKSEFLTEKYCKKIIPKLVEIMQNAVLYDNEENDDEEEKWNIFAHASVLLGKIMWCFSDYIYSLTKNFILSNRRNPNFYYSVLLFLFSYSSVQSPQEVEAIESNMNVILDYINLGVPQIVQIAISIIKIVSMQNNMFCSPETINRTIEILVGNPDAKSSFVVQTVECLSVIISKISNSQIEQILPAIVPLIIGYVSHIVTREDSSDYDIARKSYGIFEDIVQKLPSNMSETVVGLFSSAFEQIHSTINELTYEGPVPYFTINECLMHLIAQCFTSFPSEMKQFSNDVLNFILQNIKDPSHQLYKDSMTVITSIVVVLGPESELVLPSLNGILSASLSSNSPEFIQQAIVLLKALVSSSIGEIVEDAYKTTMDLINIISDSEMVMIAPMSLKAIAQVMEAISSKVTIEMLQVLVSKTNELCSINFLQNQQEFEFRNEAFVAYCTIASIVLRILGKIGYENILIVAKVLFDLLKYFKNFIDYDEYSLNSFCMLVQSTYEVLGPRSQRLLTRIPIFSFLILAINCKNREISTNARNLFEICSKL